MEEIKAPWNAKRTSYKRIVKKILSSVVLVLVAAILIAAVGTAITYGILKGMGFDVNIAKPIDWQATFQPERFDSINNGHHTQVDNDPNRFWSIVQEQEDKDHLDNYFVIRVPAPDGTWITEYIVSWRDY